MTVKASEYNEMKMEFIKRHGNDFRISTNLVDNVNTKIYSFPDGSFWEEISQPYPETIKVERRGVMFDVEVYFYRTEFFSTDDSTSRYIYEKL